MTSGFDDNFLCHKSLTDKNYFSIMKTTHVKIVLHIFLVVKDVLVHFLVVYNVQLSQHMLAWRADLLGLLRVMLSFFEHRKLHTFICFIYRKSTT